MRGELEQYLSGKRLLVDTDRADLPLSDCSRTTSVSRYRSLTGEDMKRTLEVARVRHGVVAGGRASRLRVRRARPVTAHGDVEDEVLRERGNYRYSRRRRKHVNVGIEQLQLEERTHARRSRGRNALEPFAEALTGAPNVRVWFVPLGSSGLEEVSVPC